MAIYLIRNKINNKCYIGYRQTLNEIIELKKIVKTSS